MSTPRLGDVIVRGHGHGTMAIFVIVEPVAERMLSGPFKSLSAAVNAAQGLLSSDGRVWHQQVDMFGHSLGPPILVPPLSRC